MSTPPAYLKSPPPEYANKLCRISRALTGTDEKSFKQRLRCEGLGAGEVERNDVLELLWILDRRRKITSDKPDILVQILNDIEKAELIREEFPEFYPAGPTTVSDTDLDWLASRIMGPDWESFARQQLKIPQCKIEQCKAGVYPVNLKEQVFKVLAEWKHKQGRGATYDALTELLQLEDQKLVHDWNERLHTNATLQNVKK